MTSLPEPLPGQPPDPAPPPRYEGRYVNAGGVPTHYIEAGRGYPVILIHSGEYGASAELCWRYNIAALSRHFRVLAPDLVGFGKTAKLHDFAGPSDFRIRHIREFCEALGIDQAHFVGCSYGGSLLLRVASSASLPAWPIDRIVAVSGGGRVPLNEQREVLLNYDGTREHMRRILQVLFFSEPWWHDRFVDEWHSSSLVPGAWECSSAARLVRPGASKAWRPESSDPANVSNATLVVAGAEDYLREPGYAPLLASQLQDGRCHVFAEARHFPHIEHVDVFNDLAIKHLLASKIRQP